jgi:hypothetical protein
VLVAIILATDIALACPFCSVVAPTFAERRECATVCALAEALEKTAAGWRFQLHRVHQGDGEIAASATVEFDPKLAFQPGDLALLLGSKELDAEAQSWRWEAVPVSEVSYRYFSGAPTLRAPAAERLKYFVPFLESPEPEIAADAFAEFGRAPLEAVEAVADREMIAKARDWVQSEILPDERRGGFALLLGLARTPAEREASAQVLRTLIDQPREDFRAGFDGVLGAYLLLEPEAALRLIDERYVTPPDARPGDTRHALNALRFCMEYRRGPKREAMLEVMHHGLARPAVAADIITDLARWKDWSRIDGIAALYDPTSGKDGAPLRRAVIGYLKVCPEATAKAQFERIRALDPDGINRIEERLNAPLDR